MRCTIIPCAHPDGVATRTLSSTWGLLLPLHALDGPEEDQDCGSMHAHMSGYFVASWSGKLRDDLRAAWNGEQLRERLCRWNKQVVEVVRSREQDRVHEVLAEMRLGHPPRGDQADPPSDQMSHDKC